MAVRIKYVCSPPRGAFWLFWQILLVNVRRDFDGVVLNFRLLLRILYWLTLWQLFLLCNALFWLFIGACKPSDGVIPAVFSWLFCSFPNGLFGGNFCIFTFDLILFLFQKLQLLFHLSDFFSELRFFFFHLADFFCHSRPLCLICC